MNKEKIVKIIQGYEHLDTDFVAIGCAEDIAEEILNALPEDTRIAELEAENACITDAYKLLIDKLNAEVPGETNISP